MSEIEQKQCPDCGKMMDILISLNIGTTYVCSNRTCKLYNDPFDRYEDKRMDAMDMEQEMRKGMDDE